MAEKTYKFVSVCERPKPVQTNNAYQFTWHVAFCKTCLEKLPEGTLKQLEPKLSQFISERAKPKIPGPAGTIKLPPEQKPPVETIALTADAEKVKKGMKPGIVVEDSRINGSKIIPQTPKPPLPPKPKADKEQQSQFDKLIQDSPVFQGLAKSVEGLKSEITGQINSLGDMMQTRMEQVFKGISGEGAIKETKEELPPDQTPPPETPPETGATGGNVDRSGRSGSFGQSGPLPAGMQDGYKAGDKSPPQIPPSDTPPGIEKPPPGIEQPPPPDTTGEGMPKLQTPEQISLFKRYVAEEEARMAGGGGGKVASKTTVVKDIRESADKWLGTVEKVVNMIKGKSSAGEGQPSALAGTPIGEMLSMVKGVNDLTMGNFKGMFEMIKAVREAEKLIWTEPPAPPSSSRPRPSPGTKENIT